MGFQRDALLAPGASVTFGVVTALERFGDVDALRATLERLLGDAGARAELEARAVEAAATTYAWSSVAERHEALYRALGES